jgi:threonine aldolase
VETNILFFRVTRAKAAEVVAQLEARGVRMLALGPETIRAVTHLNVSAADIERALGIAAEVLG